jgi:hypothetical protein
MGQEERAQPGSQAPKQRAMHEPNVRGRNFAGRAGVFLAALFLGAAAGLFAHAYWLADLLPLGSRQLLALSAAVSLLATAGYSFLLPWLWRQFRQLSQGIGALLAVAGLPLAAFLLLCGTEQWLSTNRYIPVLLPRHQVQISAVPPTGDGVSLTWFHTSLGDVSYATITRRGWMRRGDALVLQDGVSNELRWAGLTGEQLQLVFDGGKPGDSIGVGVDGEQETVRLSGAKTAYSRNLAVPFYASRTAVILLGLLTFLFLSWSLMLAARTGVRSMPRSVPEAGSPVSVFNRRDALAILAALGLALALRVLNLENVYPAVDEYYHLIAAQQVANGAPLAAVYPRSLWLVTVPVAGILRLFGHQLWLARLVGALFNAAAIIPLYMIARKINRSIAILACLLYATSPWIVTFARIAREYAFYPFYFYWIILAMISIAELVPPNFVLLRDLRSILRGRFWLLSAALLVPPVFALSLDSLSTFRTVLIAYLVLGLFVLTRFDWKARANWPILALLAAGLMIFGWNWYAEQGDKVLAAPRLNLLPLRYFLPSPQQQAYFDRLTVLIALSLVAALVLTVQLRATHFVPLFLVCLFGSYAAVFSLFSRSFFHTRHLLTTEIWFLPVLAIGLYAVWRLVRALVPWKGASISIVVAALLGAAVTNVPQVLLPSLSTNPDMPISEDYLHEMSGVQSYMLAHAQPGDAVISTVYGLYAAWQREPSFFAQYRITAQSSKDYILSVVDLYPSGWIVIDKIRLDLAALTPKDFMGTDQIEYIGVFGDEYVWHWNHGSASMSRAVTGE